MHKGHVTSVAVVGLLFFAGCSSSEKQTLVNEIDSEKINKALVESGPPQAQADNAETEFDETLVSTSDLKARAPILLQRYAADGSELTLYFEMETQSCFGLEVEHSETDSDVEIFLWTGLLPGIDPDDCGIGIYSYNTVVDLDKPLGNREIVTSRPPTTPEPVENAANADDSSGSEDKALEVKVDDDGRPDPGQFIGLTIEEATDLAEGNSFTWHVAKIDGEPLADTSPGGQHLVFEIEEELVVAADIS